MSYTADVTPIITAAEAVQALIEAIQPLERTAGPEVREAIARARRKRAELMQWVDEQRQSDNQTCHFSLLLMAIWPSRGKELVRCCRYRSASLPPTASPR